MPSNSAVSRLETISLRRLDTDCCTVAHRRERESGRCSGGMAGVVDRDVFVA